MSSSYQESVIPQNQSQPKRAEAMTNILKKNFQKPIKALEIGVWYGIGSTNIWLQNLEPGSELVLLDSWKPYASSADIEGVEMRPTYWNYAKMDSLTTDAFLSAFLNIRKFENEKNTIDISLIRGSSSKLLKLIKDESFDFIYIDADHKYEAVKNDIQNSKRLINKKWGIICGDDLEKKPTPELIDVAKNFKDRDYLKGNYGFHPGVCLAISEEFKEVNMENGFWWVYCNNGEFSSSSKSIEK